MVDIPEACLRSDCIKNMLSKAEAAMRSDARVELCPLMALAALELTTKPHLQQLLPEQTRQCSDGGRNLVMWRPPTSANAVFAVAATRKALQRTRSSQQSPGSSVFTEAETSAA